MIRFVRKASEPYRLITPWSPLSELEDFLKTNIFALGTFLLISSLSFWRLMMSQSPIMNGNLSWPSPPPRTLRISLPVVDCNFQGWLVCIIFIIYQELIRSSALHDLEHPDEEKREQYAKKETAL
jgi:hypothetical protein